MTFRAVYMLLKYEARVFRNDIKEYVHFKICASESVEAVLTSQEATSVV